MKTPEETWQAALGAVIKKAGVDAEFRRLCLEDAAGAIREASGFEVPADARIRFVAKLEETVIVLPKEAGELSDDQLGRLSAGARSAVDVLTGGEEPWRFPPYPPR